LPDYCDLGMGIADDFPNVGADGKASFPRTTKAINDSLNELLSERYV
jgi:hypothetical protein